jgi:hypothetical protein
MVISYLLKIGLKVPLSSAPQNGEQEVSAPAFMF